MESEGIGRTKLRFGDRNSVVISVVFIVALVRFCLHSARMSEQTSTPEITGNVVTNCVVGLYKPVYTAAERVAVAQARKTVIGTLNNRATHFASLKAFDQSRAYYDAVTVLLEHWSPTP